MKLDKLLLFFGISLTIIGAGLVDPILAAQNPVNQAVSFLVSSQTRTGRIGGLQASAWAAMALKAANEARSEPAAKLRRFLSDKTAEIDPSIPTELERHIMGLVSLGADPTIIAGRDLVAELLNHKKNGQFGAPELINDDVFGVIALSAVNRPVSDYSQSVKFLIDNQTSGGWAAVRESRPDSDMTAAALIALNRARQAGIQNLDQAIETGLRQLEANQLESGAFALSLDQNANVSSTTWALWALSELGLENQKAVSWLISQQRHDGSFEPSLGSPAPVLTTAYALIALAGQPLPLAQTPDPPIQANPALPQPIPPNPAKTEQAQPRPQVPNNNQTSDKIVSQPSEEPSQLRHPQASGTYETKPVNTSSQPVNQTKKQTKLASNLVARVGQSSPPQPTSQVASRPSLNQSGIGVPKQPSRLFWADRVQPTLKNRDRKLTQEIDPLLTLGLIITSIGLGALTVYLVLIWDEQERFWRQQTRLA